MCRAAKNLSSSVVTDSAEMEQGEPLPYYFCSHSINRCPFYRVFSVNCSYFCEFSGGGNQCLKWPLYVVMRGCSVFLRAKGRVMYLVEKMCMLIKRHSSMSCHVVYCKFNVNECTFYIK